MPNADFPAILTSSLLDLLESWGVDADAIATRAHLARIDLSRPAATVTRESHLEVVRQGLAICGRPDLGLQFGKRISLAPIFRRKRR